MEKKVRTRYKVLAGAVAVSTLVHAAAVIFGSRQGGQDTRAGSTGDAGTADASAYEGGRVVPDSGFTHDENIEGLCPSEALARDMASLVDRARGDLRRGNLQLGRFILRANRLERMERCEPVSDSVFESANARYDRYLSELRAELSSGTGIREAIPHVLNRVHYYGRGGTMMGSIIEGGGSCEPISHLVASLVYDSGHRDEAYLRIYGPNRCGFGHIAPILNQGGGEYDLTTGDAARARGVRMRAGELVEAFARRHGIRPYRSGIRPMEAGEWESGFQYERTSERYEDDDSCEPPEYCERAILRPGEPPGAGCRPGAMCPEDVSLRLRQRAFSALFSIPEEARQAAGAPEGAAVHVVVRFDIRSGVPSTTAISVSCPGCTGGTLSRGTLDLSGVPTGYHGSCSGSVSVFIPPG